MDADTRWSGRKKVQTDFVQVSLHPSPLADTMHHSSYKHTENQEDEFLGTGHFPLFRRRKG